MGKWAATPRRRRSALGTIAGCWVAVSLLAVPAFLSSWLPAGDVDSNKQGAIFRRRDLASAGAVATFGQFQASPVHAAGPPQEYLSVSGLEKPHEKANGVWQMQAGKELNKRPVYKRQGEELYLMINDCGQFQMAKSATGECSGFAQQTGKGKWLIDGTESVGKVKVKPGNFVKGVKVEVVKEFRSDDDDKALLKQGLKGVVDTVDSEGDLAVKFDGFKDVMYVMRENFGKMKRL